MSTGVTSDVAQDGWALEGEGAERGAYCEDCPVAMTTASPPAAEIRGFGQVARRLAGQVGLTYVLVTAESNRERCALGPDARTAASMVQVVFGEQPGRLLPRVLPCQDGCDAVAEFHKHAMATIHGCLDELGRQQVSFLLICHLAGDEEPECWASADWNGDGEALYYVAEGALAAALREPYVYPEEKGEMVNNGSPPCDLQVPQQDHAGSQPPTFIVPNSTDGEHLPAEQTQYISQVELRELYELEPKVQRYKALMQSVVDRHRSGCQFEVGEFGLEYIKGFEREASQKSLADAVGVEAACRIWHSLPLAPKYRLRALRNRETGEQKSIG